MTDMATADDSGRLIGTFTLKRVHEIYDSDNEFVWVRTDGHGRQYTDTISKEIVSASRSALTGQDWTRETAAVKLLSRAVSDNWPYTYGYQQRYYVEGTLLPLVASNQARFWPEGRGFRYEVF